MKGYFESVHETVGYHKPLDRFDYTMVFVLVVFSPLVFPLYYLFHVISFVCSSVGKKLYEILDGKYGGR